MSCVYSEINFLNYACEITNCVKYFLFYEGYIQQ